MNKFSVQINGGKIHEIETRTGIYQQAALASLAMVPYRKRKDIQIIKIWAPNLLPDYGPYTYGFFDCKICSLIDAAPWMLTSSIQSIKDSLVKCPKWLNQEPKVWDTLPTRLHLFN